MILLPAVVTGVVVVAGEITVVVVVSALVTGVVVVSNVVKTGVVAVSAVSNKQISPSCQLFRLDVFYCFDRVHVPDSSPFFYPRQKLERAIVTK